MKANEAPEKIYIPTILVANTVRYKEEGSIEYTRTDAFINKACKFISLNVADYIDVTNKGGIEHLALQERFIECFRKYMKNE